MAGINLKYKDIHRLLLDNGFIFIRNSGDHKIYKRNNKTISVPCPNCNGLILQRLLKENNIKYERR